jgi:hypothetical protein
MESFQVVERCKVNLERESRAAHLLSMDFSNPPSPFYVTVTAFKFVYVL